MVDRLMTQKTLEILKDQQALTEKKVAEMGGQSDGGHARAGFHDDAGFEHERNRVRADLVRIGNLNEASIIKPRLITDDIGIGNKVRARFIEESSDETIYLLGEDDVIRRKDLDGTIVSAASPLGLALIGKAKNDIAEVKIGSSGITHVKILNIEKGDF